MDTIERNKKLLNEKFKDLNNIFIDKNIYATLILIGGTAGRVLINDFRPTFDIDVIIRELKGTKDINSLIKTEGMQEVTVCEVPIESEIEAEDTMEYSNLKVVIPKIEYFAITKIFSTRAKDESDLLTEKIIENCDKEILEKLIKENRQLSSVGYNPLANINTLYEKFKEHGITL